MKLGLLTKATVVDDAIRFTAEYSKKLKLKLSSSYEEEEEDTGELPKERGGSATVNPNLLI